MGRKTMSTPISGFINTKTGELLAAHPASHSRGQKLLGLRLDVGENYSEYEWPRVGLLMVRNTSFDTSRLLRNAILAQYRTRDALIAATRPQWERHGNYLVECQADADRLPPHVDGDVIWQPDRNVIAPQLTIVTGDLYLGSLTALDAGALPSLAQTGYLYLSSLTALDAGALPSLAPTSDLDPRSPTAP